MAVSFTILTERAVILNNVTLLLKNTATAVKREYSMKYCYIFRYGSCGINPHQMSVKGALYSF